MTSKTTTYPAELEKPIKHARRLAKVLGAMENSVSGTWVIGLASELKTVVSCAVTDLRSGRVDTDHALRSILTYVDDLHCQVAKHLRRRSVALECCEPDDVITTPGGEAGSGAVLTLLSVITVAGRDTSPTEESIWVDPPEVLERFRSGLAWVERLAKRFLRRVGPSSITADDLCAFGREGLLDAARSFQDGRGLPFSEWADMRMRNAMLDGVRSWGGVPRGALHQLRSMAAENHGTQNRGLGGRQRAGTGGELEIEDLTNPEQLLVRMEDRRLVQTLLERLPTRERTLVEGYFLRGMTLEQVGPVLGITKSGASLALKRALLSMARDAQGLLARQPPDTSPMVRQPTETER